MHYGLNKMNVRACSTDHEAHRDKLILWSRRLQFACLSLNLSDDLLCNSMLNHWLYSLLPISQSPHSFHMIQLCYTSASCLSKSCWDILIDCSFFLEFCLCIFTLSLIFSFSRFICSFERKQNRVWIYSCGTLQQSRGAESNTPTRIRLFPAIEWDPVIFKNDVLVMTEHGSWNPVYKVEQRGDCGTATKRGD